MTYQDYAAAHRKQQIDIWSAIESGELQKAVDIFAAGIQIPPHNPDRKTGDNRTLTKRRKSGIIKAIRRYMKRRKRKQEEKAMKIYEITDIKAIAECAGDNEPQNAVLVHEIKDKFNDGDCILFGYSSADFENDLDILTALQNETPESDFTIDKHGIYHA